MSHLQKLVMRPLGGLFVGIVAFLILLAAAGVLWRQLGPAGATGTAQVAAGGGHTCAVTAAGGTKCWGFNNVGQLGDGTTVNETAPVDVTGLTSGAIFVTAGGNHSCARTNVGGVKCWGWNAHGQMGDGTLTDRHTPVGVTGLTSGVTSIAAGGNHSCALTTAGGVKCWGRNVFGQLGDGTTTSQSVPVNVIGLTSGVASVAAGENHSCALTVAAGVKCWGLNDYGQLGDGTTTSESTSVDVTGLPSGVASVATGGNHSCALTTAGGVKCWGENTYGELGDGHACGTLCKTPVNVTGLSSGIAAIATGTNHSCALTTAGGLKCWGYNQFGQLGTTTSEFCGSPSSQPCSTTPANVTGMTSGAAVIGAGADHTCAAMVAGGVKCWGDNTYGELGDGQACGYACTTPVDVSGLGPKAVGGIARLPEPVASAPVTSRTSDHSDRVAAALTAAAAAATLALVAAAWYTHRRHGGR